MLKPRIFVSAVTREFKTIRKVTADILTRLGYEPELQDIFGTEPGDLRQVLRDKIDGCEGLIQIVGHAYGAEPPTVDPDFGRVSYTQFELLYAQHRGKKTWVIVPADGCTRDKPLDDLDLPPEPNHADPSGWQLERRALQEAYRTRLNESGHLRHSPENDDRLALAIERLRDEFAILRRRYRAWQRQVAVALVVIVLLLVTVGGVVSWNHRTQQASLQKIHENQRVTRERIRAQLLEAAERARGEALESAKSVPNWEEREKLREGAEKVYQTTLTRIDQLAQDFATIERTEQATPLFDEMTRILKEEGVDAALAYLDRHRGDVFARAKSEKEEAIEKNRTELRPYLTGARLKAVNGQLDSARKEFQDLLALDENWPELLHDAAWFLQDLSFITMIHGTLVTAVADAQQALDLAERLNRTSPKSPEHQAVHSGASDQMANVLMMRGHSGDAKQALTYYTRNLEISKSILKDNPDSATALRNVLTGLIRLGDFLVDRGQPGDTERAFAHFTRSLEIGESLLSANAKSARAPSDVAAVLLRLGNLLTARGQPGDAEQALKHYTRSLEIADSVMSANPDSLLAALDVSINLNRFGAFLVARGHPGDSEQALTDFIRSLEISESAWKVNPDSAQAARGVAESLNRLGTFLAARGQPGDAEQALHHYTRALEISESQLKSNPDFAQAAREISCSLGLLGDFLVERGPHQNVEQAVAHYTRSLEISDSLLKSNPDSGQGARDLSVTLDRLGAVLSERSEPGDAEQALAHFTRALRISETILNANPDSALASSNLAACFSRLGNFFTARDETGDKEQAQSYFTRCLEIRESLLKLDPDSVSAARDIFAILRVMAAFMPMVSEPDGAQQVLKHYNRQLEIAEFLLKSEPDSKQTAHVVSWSLAMLASSLAARGQPGDLEQALKHCTRDLEIRESLLKASPDSDQAARDVLGSFRRLGAFARVRGQAADPEHVLQRYTRELEIVDLLLKSKPDSVLAASDVSFSLIKLGDFVADRGQPGDAVQALAHYNRSLEIIEPIVNANPDSTDAASDVFVCLTKLGDFLAARGQPGDAELALKHYTRYLEISESLLKARPDAAEVVRDVFRAHIKLARFFKGTGGNTFADVDAAARHIRACRDLLDSPATELWDLYLRSLILFDDDVAAELREDLNE